jgi:hypothetical protein
MVGHFNIGDLKPDTLISALRLLLDGYKLFGDRFKNKETPEKVGEILTRAEKTPSVDTKQIEQSITQALGPEDAAIVKNDLSLLSLLGLPTPSLDAFDYWGKLEELVAALQAFATKNQLFELRGFDDQMVGEGLSLLKTSTVLMPKNLAFGLATPYRRQKVDEVHCMVVLQKQTKEFPLRVIVAAVFSEYNDFGDSHPVSDTTVYSVGPGPQRHWLRFSHPVSHTHFLPGEQYRLDAADFIAIVNALRDDIREYAAEVHADEKMIALLFGQIDAVVEKMKS